MAGRRVIVHAGFHKTGTTTVQRFLRSNGKQIWPRCALVLPGKLRQGASRMAVLYSRSGSARQLDAFASELHAVLSSIDAGAARKVLISDENLAGRMPGRDGQADYAATPALMTRAEGVIHDVFGEDADVVFHFTTRKPQDWLHSTYKHNLRATRLALAPSEYAQAYGPAATLEDTVRAVDGIVKGTVQTADLADLTGPFGPVAPLVDLIDLPPHRLRNLAPIPPHNVGPPDTVLDAFLTLNRSSLDDDAVDAAKAKILQEEQADE